MDMNQAFKDNFLLISFIFSMHVSDCFSVISITVQDVMLCCLVVVVLMFRRNVLSPTSELTEATGSSKPLVPTYQRTQHHWLGHCSGTALDLYS